MIREIEIFRCPVCNYRHEDEWDARHCCSIEGEYVFECLSCKKVWDHEEDAERCCPGENEEAEGK